VYGSDAVREALLRDVFNDRVWPDLIRLSHDESPFLRFKALLEQEPVVIEGITMTPVLLNHVLPTFGYIVEDEKSAVAIISDTSPTDAVWRVAAAKPHLKAVFLEAAFPNRMAWLADKAGHLTPKLFATEYAKLGRELPVIAVHIKPAFHEEVTAELESLGLPQLIIARPNEVYEW
jgi:cAMP phosphodiesterase